MVLLRRLAAVTLAMLVISLGLSSCGPKPSTPAQPVAPPATNAVSSAENLQRLKVEAERQRMLREREGAQMERSSAKKSFLLEERPSMSEPSSIPAAPDKAGDPLTSRAVPDPMQIR